MFFYNFCILEKCSYCHLPVLLLAVMAAMPAAIAAVAAALKAFLFKAVIAIAKMKISPLNAQDSSIHQSSSYLAASRFIDFLYSSSSYTHAHAALLLRHPLLVHQAESFILIQSQDNWLIAFLLA